MLTIAAGAQTLNVQVGSVTYQFPASQTGEMTYTDGNTLTILNKVFTLSDISSMTVDDSNVTDGTVTIVTSGGLYYNNGTTENSNYTGNTDNVSSDYYSSPKGIKAGVKTQNGNSYTYAGGLVISGGTEYFGGMANVGGTVINGSTVTLSTYSGGNSGPGGH